MDTENQNLDYENQSTSAPEEEPIDIIEDNSPQEEHKSAEQESSHIDRSEHSEHEEEAAPKKKKSPNKYKVGELMRERYALEQERNIIADERNRLLQEVENLKQVNKFSQQAAVTNYETSTLDRLERAKDLKTQALESGDIKAQVDADIALNKAMNEYERLADWKEKQRISDQQQQYEEQSNQNYYNSQAQQQQLYQDQTAPNEQVATQWVKDNEWFNEGSEGFEPELRRFTEDLTNSMDAYLYRAGMQHGIYSPEYFEYLDERIEDFKSGKYDHMRTEPSRNHYQQRNQQMTRPKSVTSGVSNSGYRNNVAINNRRQVKLNSDEMDMASRLSNIPGVSPEAYARAVMNDRQKPNTGRR